jgi:hypothetical protein
MCVNDILIYFQIGAYTAAIGGIIFTAFGYFKNNKLKRGEWLKQLFEKFYEQEKFQLIRRKIEYGALIDYLDLDEKGEPKDDLHEEEFVNYLNFFEFIAVLQKEGHVSKAEVNDLFGYYFKKLKQEAFIINYIKKTDYGFENISNLLKLNEHK